MLAIPTVTTNCSPLCSALKVTSKAYYDNIIQAMGPDKQTGPISIVRELKLRDEITTEPLIVEVIILF